MRGRVRLLLFVASRDALLPPAGARAGRGLFALPVDVAMVLHGIVFTAWMILFIVQTRLIAAHSVRAHMRLGIWGVGLAALVFVFGLITVVASASAPRPRPMGMVSWQFVFVPFFIIITFAAL